MQQAQHFDVLCTNAVHNKVPRLMHNAPAYAFLAERQVVKPNIRCKYIRSRLCSNAAWVLLDIEQGLLNEKAVSKRCRFAILVDASAINGGDIAARRPG